MREEEMEKWKEEHKQVQEELRSSQSMMDEETSSLKFRISALVMERDKASQVGLEEGIVFLCTSTSGCNYVARG